MTTPKLLIIEDDLGLCSQYRWAFPDCEVLFAHDRPQAMAAAAQHQPAVAIMDLGLPPDPDGVSEGFATLDGIALQAPGTKVIVATSHGDRSHALRAIAAGAYDFCEKPIDIGVLGAIVARSLKRHTLEAENRRQAEPTATGIRGITSADPAMLKVCREVERLAGAGMNVLLLGEAGTGKEALARTLHELGPRSAGPFAALNCATTPEALLEAELFGHERGPGTPPRPAPGRIEVAGGGTVFLDEVAGLPPPLQLRLLRALTERRIERVGGRQPVPVNVQLISASAQPLAVLAAEGRFRGDLLGEMAAATLRVPPLRDRGGDKVLLARTLMEQFNREFSRSVRALSEDAVAAINRHGWPGNVRELENRMKRAVVMAETRFITAADLELAPGVEDMTAYDLRAARSRAERDVVQRALARSNGTLATAARLLGVSRPTLYSLLDLHGLTPDQPADAAGLPTTLDATS